MADKTLFGAYRNLRGLMPVVDRVLRTSAERFGHAIADDVANELDVLWSDMAEAIENQREGQ